MSREIKFRAWHTANKVMMAHKDIPVGLKNVRNDKVWKYMQFTGLLDKNGVEIYEGDIVHVDWKDPRYEPLVSDVTWSAIHASWEVGAGASYETEWSHEVIGNIHENPELLEES